MKLETTKTSSQAVEMPQYPKCFSNRCFIDKFQLRFNGSISMRGQKVRMCLHSALALKVATLLARQQEREGEGHSSSRAFFDG